MTVDALVATYMLTFVQTRCFQRLLRREYNSWYVIGGCYI